MDKAQPTLPVKLTVLHHARSNWILAIGSVCTCLMIGEKRVEMVATLAFVQLSLMALAYATRTSDWGAQPVLATESGLQIGTMLRDLRGSDLRGRERLLKGYQLRGRFLTLQLRVDDAQVAALEGMLSGLGPFTPAKKEPGILTALGWMALGGVALFVVWRLGADDPLDRARLCCLLFAIAAAAADGVGWFYYKRAGRRL